MRRQEQSVNVSSEILNARCTESSFFLVVLVLYVCLSESRKLSWS